MACQAVLFDLDGTLVDSLEDIAHAANSALASGGFPPHELKAYRQMIGDGSAVLMSRAIPEASRTAETVHFCLDAYIEAYYRRHHRSTRPYPGVTALLERLADRRIPMAVVSNKPAPLAARCIADVFSDVPFHPVLGLREGVARKPAPDPALEAASILDVPPEHCWFLGDSPMDMICAGKAGMRAIGVAWGYRTDRELTDAGAMTVLQHPLDLLRISGVENNQRRPSGG